MGYPDVYAAANDVPDFLRFNPVGLEGIDETLIQFEKVKGAHDKAIAGLPAGNGWLYVEFGGDSKQESDDKARQCMDALKQRPNPPSMRLYDNPQEELALWEVRESSLGSTAFVPGSPDTWPGWEDSAVPVARIGEYVRKLRELFDKFGYHVSTYGHFGQGIIHCRIPFNLYTQEGIDKYRRFMDEATDLCHSLGGSFSGEHGDGQARAMYLPKMFGPKLVQAFGEFKSIWDPQWKMNPGKVVDPYSVTENMRLSQDYNPPQPKTYFQFPDDRFTFSRAALRCVGVGECRREGGQVMCPSYMVTREEMHSTRGRARLLWEMLNGEVLADGWRNETVNEALDLCLACKGCKGDCPVNVDMATYKAEFRAHHYARRLRPRYMYAFGWIHIWSRLASFMPTIANFFTQTPGLSRLAKFIAGTNPRRPIPAFAPGVSRSGSARGQVPNAPARPWCSTPTRSTITFSRIRPSPPSKCWRMPAFRSSSPCRICAAAGRFTTTDFSAWPAAGFRTTSTRSAPTSKRAFPWSCSSPVAGRSLPTS